ncbi:uncharacterized protein LOC124274985 isoform X1 [Haliotis rubra]|uniref:uncharacterized protein LOC124274985 isoform X1 n=1 Tax=Haliotis rubra TaxID=36100 RepID=UPI001EE51228|nr:uncharacterized protein LOC124274985 isoform X1 [Haliotis rubra]
MFIETLEFTIPIDLCDLFSTLKRGPRSNLEFPASVNSYGTTQDANIQVALRSNKLTFKVDGVSSNSSMISKSECKTLKLSVFDVDCSLSGAEYEQVTHMVSQPIYSAPHVIPAKRSRDRPSPMKSPPSKTSRSSFQETKHQNIPLPSPDPLQSKSMSETVSVKLEPDLIEIEPDSEQYGDESNQSIDRRHNTQAALDRLSHPQSSHSQSSASSSSSFHQNVPHVPDYAEPSTSQGDHHGDQNIDDYVVYQQEDDDYGEDNDNSALISEMMLPGSIVSTSISCDCGKCVGYVARTQEVDVPRENVKRNCGSCLILISPKMSMVSTLREYVMPIDSCSIGTIVLLQMGKHTTRPQSPWNLHHLTQETHHVLFVSLAPTEICEEMCFCR